ncbi:MAG: hypothetical protein J6Z46_01805 [Lachnospiraceae bacterium]|nr:hypothetical protein [Lachnospiraceae bacterium]
MEEKEISLIELFSLCVRNGGKALIAAIVLAVLLSGYQYYAQVQTRENTARSALGVTDLGSVSDWEKKAADKINEDNQAELQEYEDKASSLRADIDYYKDMREELNKAFNEALDGRFYGDTYTAPSLSNSIISIDNKVATMTKSLDELVKPVKKSIPAVSIKKAVLWGVIGAFSGILIVGAVVFLRVLIMDRMECSFQLERDLKIPFLGSVMGKRGIFDKLADKINGERVWKDSDTALSYIAGSAALRCKNAEKILLLSTCEIGNEVSDKVTGVLKRGGLGVNFADDFRHSPKAVEELKECDGIILLEKRGTSEMKTVNEAVSLAKASEKQILGFVMVNGK